MPTISRSGFRSLVQALSSGEERYYFNDYLCDWEIGGSYPVVTYRGGALAADSKPLEGCMRGRAAMSVAGVLLGMGGSCQGALADTPELSAIVVTATRVAESSADLPVSVDRVDRHTIADGQLQVNLSESLITVPGVSVQSRQNYAQDLQLSVRGFGARSSFGVRGIRLYSDGIPGTMPDGQGQFSQFDLGSADHIEVLRGPFSALYGNSSGGVIAIFTEDAKPGHEVDGTEEYGTFNTQRYALKTTGDNGVVNYVVDASHFQTDGYRVHSDAERNLFNAKASTNLS